MDGPDAILEPLRADPARAAILCDVDGTLAPIVEDPASAAVPAEARRRLRELTGRYGLIACVSGRRATDARRVVGLDELTYAGNHGLELLAPGEDEPRLDPALGDRGGAAAAFVAGLDLADLAAAGIRLEDKGPIQAIHWRGAADLAVAEQRARSLAEQAIAAGLVAHFGRMVLELRPLAEIDKGVAVRTLIGTGLDSALFAGDDATDLDAFAALGEMLEAGELRHGVRIGIASEEGPAAIRDRADLVVEGTRGFLALLRRL